MKYLLLVGVITFLFGFSSPVSAATFTFSGTPSSITGEESFSVSVVLSVSSSAGNNYYIRIAFSHPDSPSSYFGYTKNNAGNWYNGTPSPIDKTQFYKVTMDENNQWTGTIEAKPDIESSAYKGSGTYNFKLGRYTESGSLTWCNNESTGCAVASVSIVTTATPTPTPAPTNTPVPTATPIQSGPTTAPTATKTPTSTLIKTPTPTLKSVSGGESSSTSTTKPPTTSPTTLAFSSQAAGGSGNINTAVSPTVNLSPTPTKSESTKKPTPTPIKSGQTAVLGVAQSNLSKILIGLGVIFLAACGIIAFRSFRTGKKDESDY